MDEHAIANIIKDMQMKAVFFDFDGVIIRSMEDHYEGWRKALEDYGIDMAPEELYLMEGSNAEALAGQFIRKFNIPFEEAPKIIQKKELYYDQVKTNEIYPDLLDIFIWIEERELKTALISDGEYDAVMKILRTLDLDDKFNTIITADQVFYTKPSPEPFLKAASLLNVLPEDCIVIENAPLGIRSAKVAGMKCIAVTTTLSPMHLKAADVVTDDLEMVLQILKRMY